MESTHKWESSGADLEHRDRTGRQGVGTRGCVCDGDVGSVRALTRTCGTTHTTGNSTRHTATMTSRRVVGRHWTASICKRCSRAALPCYRNCPHSVRGRFRQAVGRALKARSEAVRVQDLVREARGWKLFCLLPVWLLQRSAGTHRVPKEELVGRFDLFS